MCYGAMVHARIDKCVFGADSKSGVVSTGVVSATKNSVNHTVKFFVCVTVRVKERIFS